LFLEVGAEYSYLTVSGTVISGATVTETDHSLSVPLHVTWKFGNEKFAVATFAGESLLFHLSHKSGDLDVLEQNGVNRFQATFDLGVNFVIANHLELGYRYQISELKFIDVSNNNYTNNFTIGYLF